MNIQLHHHGLESSKGLTEFVERTLHSALRRFASRLSSTIVHLHDLNGPRSGIDQECRIQVRTAQGPVIVITERDSSMLSAIGRSVERMREAVRRQLGFRLSSRRRKPQLIDLKVRGNYEL